MILALAFAFLGAACATWLALFPLRTWLSRAQWLDRPNQRSSHSAPVPRGGGLAFVGLTLLGLLVFQGSIGLPGWRALLAYGFGSLIVAGIGLVDDVRGLSVQARLSAQALAAGLVIWGIGHWTISGPAIVLDWAGLALTFVWILGLTNAFNFMDGIDGLAAVQTVVAGLGVSVIALVSGVPALAIWAGLVAGAAAGFLGHNWQPAALFMGDVGSTFLGYTFAVLPLSLAADWPALSVACVLPLWPFVFDASMTFLKRLLHKENVFSAHRSHLYQRLVIAGASHASVSIGYGVLALTGLGLSAGLVAGASWWLVGSILIVLCALLWAGVDVAERRLGLFQRSRGPG